MRRSSPGKGTGAARLVAGKLLESCALRYGETTDFDCHRVELTSSRAGVAAAEGERLFKALFIAN